MSMTMSLLQVSRQQELCCLDVPPGYGLSDLFMQELADRLTKKFRPDFAVWGLGTIMVDAAELKPRNLECYAAEARRFYNNRLKLAAYPVLVRYRGG